MSELTDRILISNVRESRQARFRRWGFIVVPLAAILFQVYLPLFFQFFGYLEMPLLVTIYLALLRRDQVSGTFIGAGIGLVQDSLSHQPLGMFGIVKTMVGYFAASVGMRFDVEHAAMRFLLCLLFVCFHQFFFWVLSSALLGQQMRFDFEQIFLVGLLNAAVGIFLFRFLDKLRERA
jgi:rod shape-determining protein MreD